MGKEQSLPPIDLRAATIANYTATAKDYITDPFEHAELLHYMRQETAILRPRALVVGCGPADDVARLTYMGWDVIGIDNAPGMIAEASRRYPDLLIQEMHMKDVGKRFPEGTFDLIFAQYSLFHEIKKDLPTTLAGFAMVLKPGGYLYLTTQESLTGIPVETVSQRSDDHHQIYINAETAESLIALLTEVSIAPFFVGTRRPSPEEHQFFKVTIGGQKVEE